MVPHQKLNGVELRAGLHHILVYAIHYALAIQIVPANNADS